MPTCCSATNTLYHQCLRGVSHLKQASAPPSISTSRPSNSATSHSHFQWDLVATSTSMRPALDFISERLVKNGLQIALLVSDQAPFVIPVWELPRKTQIILTRIVRKACSKFQISPSWMTALASLDGKKDLPRIFDQCKPDDYIIRRSLLQREIVYTAEGLMLLSVDHIYTLKQLLCTLAKPDWVAWSREICLSSCVHLLRRINAIHDGTPFTKGYIARVYSDIPFVGKIYDEVKGEYDATFCTANIRDVVSEADFGTSYYTDFEAPTAIERTNAIVKSVVELQDTAIKEIVSPMTGADARNVFPWNFETRTATPESVSHVSVSYPTISQPTSSPQPAQEAELWHRSLLTSPASEASWGPDAPPSPLKVVKRPISPLPQKLSMPSPETNNEDASIHSEGEEERQSRRLSLEALEQQEEEVRRKDMAEKSRMIVEAWCKGVQEVVCARCFDAIAEPERYGVCY